MPLNEDQAARAKQKAIEFLELNITQIALSLGVSESDLGEGYIIPVAEDDAQYKTYVTLKNMSVRLADLQA